MKKVIAIDIDDVLAANAEGFVKFSNERWGTRLVPEDYDEHWAKVWQVELNESTIRADEFHKSGIVSKYGLINGAEKVLRYLHNSFTVIAVTSRRKEIEKETREWIKKHFLGVIDDICFVGIYDDKNMSMHEKLSMTKSGILENINADYFIDDQLKHCLAASKIGINVVLFGDYSWNQKDSLPNNITRCNDWEAIGNYFASR